MYSHQEAGETVRDSATDYSTVLQSSEYFNNVFSQLITADGKKRTMDLTITKVTKDIFGKKFCLRVGNVHGLSTQEFSVQG